MLRKLNPYLITIVSVLAIGYLKILLNHLFQIDSPLLLFFAAITISTWYGGAIQGIFATIISIGFVRVYFIHSSAGLLDYYWLVRFLLFCFDCSIIILLCTLLRNSRNKMKHAFKDLKAIELSLRRSESRLRKIFESDMIGLVFSNFDGQILEANNYFLNLVGRSSADLKNQDFNWRDITPPEQMAAGERATQALRKNEFFKPFEKEYVHSDGRKISVMVGAIRLEENMMAAFILDISAQKKIEHSLADMNTQLEQSVTLRTEKLRESESFLDSVIENIPNMIFVKDAKDLRFIRINRAGELLLGQPRENMVGKNDYDFFPKEQADFFIQKDREVIKSGETLDIPEEPLASPHGTRYLHTKKIPLLNKNGEPQYLLGISEDITEKKSAEKQRVELIQAQAARTEAEKSAAQLAFLSEASGALNESLDINSMMTSFSRVINENMASWCFVDLLEEKENQIERLVSTQSPSLTPVPEGTKYSLEGKADHLITMVLKRRYPILMEKIYSHKLQEVIFDEDVTQKMMEEGAHSLIVAPLSYHGHAFGTLTFVAGPKFEAFDEMDVSVAQDLARRASFAIENATLYNRANEASRAKSAFLANISHEIRTPLGAMLGFAELMVDNPNLNTDQNGYISTIARNGRQLLRIVDEVLDLSKVESERIQIEKVEFSLPKLIEEVTSLLAIKASEKGLSLSVQKETDLPDRVKADSLRLRQILLNMIGNAIKFTSKGNVDVAVRFVKEDESGKGMLEFVITDTGIGIKPEQASILFEPFIQADNSMTRKFGGTGLGLFLSRKLARLMGGDVLILSSQFQQGSQFKITIQVDLVTEQMAGIQAKPKDPNLLVFEPRDLKVLVVDDAPDNQVLIKTLLGRMNIEVDIAENGKQGIEMATRQKYDVVMMDIQMPEMDGFEAIHLLRQMGYKGIVLALTAHAMKGDKERCLEAGFDNYLAKPVTRQSLYHSLAEYKKT